MKVLTTFQFLVLFLIPCQLLAAPKNPRVSPHDSEIIYGGNVQVNKSAGDTILLMGPWGSGALYNGQFETPNGAPAWNGWTTRDYTEPTGDGYWHVSDYNAANLNGHGPGNKAAYCGDEAIASCGPEDPEGGYGNRWEEAIQWMGTAPDPSQPCLIQLEAWLNQDTEPAYDYCYVSVKGPGFDPVDYWVSDGVLENYHLQLEFTCPPEEFTGPAGDQITLMIRFESDGGWSDSDCLYPSQGAIQIDDISVTLNSGGYQTFDDFQEGLGNWEPYIRPGVGDFAKIWTGLDDLDPCATNYTPQVAFIDDGQVVPGTGGTTCMDWCYGPGGYVVNDTGGLAGPDHHIYSMIHSPVIPWPGDEYQGCVLEWDRYEHEQLAADSPGIGSLWLVRSTASTDPEDIELAGWQDRDSGIRAGGPRYYRTSAGVWDLLEPGCRFIQMQLGAWQWGYAFDWTGHNGTPAPYFDNVRIIAYKFHGPGMQVWISLLAADGFPASGHLDLQDLGSNSIRFDVIRDVSWNDEFGFDPGDSLFCSIAPIRPGAELVDVPRLHYKLLPNPVFDPYRTSGMPNEGSVEGWRPLDYNGEPNLQGFAFDLPDTGFFFPGDVIRYFLSATDAVDGAEVQTSFVPADTTGFSDFTDLYSYNSSFTVFGLPTVRPDPDVPGQLITPSVLFWKDDWRQTGYANNSVYSWWVRPQLEGWNALRMLGLVRGEDFDVYRSRSWDNSLAARATLEQVEPYSTLLYTSGGMDYETLGNGNLPEGIPDDVGLLEQWFQTGGKNALFTGQHLVWDLYNNGGSATEAFLSSWLGVEAVDDDLRSLIDNAFAPLALSEPDNPVLVSVDSWVVYLECDVNSSYSSCDAVTPLPGALRLAQFADPAGQSGSYPYAAATLWTVPEYQAKVVSLPYDLDRIRDDAGANKSPASLPARAQLLGDILTYFGVPFVPEQASDVPDAGVLAVTNYPNPFNPRMRVDFNLPRAGQVSLKVFNLRGELVRTLLDENRPAGPGQVSWEGKDDQGSAAASGLYFYELRALNQVKVGKMTLVR